MGDKITITPEVIGEGIELHANRIITSYKGSSEIETDKLLKVASGFQERQYIYIRAFERLLFGTGQFIEDMPEALKGEVNATPEILIEKGLSVGGPTLILSSSGEVLVLISNLSPHLCKIEFNEHIASLSFAPLPLVEITL